MILLAVVFLAVCASYAAAFFVGWHLSARGRLDAGRLFQPPRRIADPLTARFQRWHDVAKMDAVRTKQWARLWLLISANNLFAVALVSRTLYSVTLVLPAYFTCQQGFRHGALFSRPAMRMPLSFAPLAVLEFGAYLIATALGINVVVAVLAGHPFARAIQLLVLFYPLVIAAICAGAWLEVRALRDRIQAVSLPEHVDIEALRAKALEMVKREWARGQGTPPPPPDATTAT